MSGTKAQSECTNEGELKTCPTQITDFSAVIDQTQTRASVQTI